MLAVHEATGRPVAIKYLSARLLGRPEFVERFRAEARALAGVADPNVARLLEYVEAPPAAAIVMELVDGVPLRRVLDASGPLPPEAALLLLHGSLRGLGAAHAVGVVHRDYKPANVLVQRDGTSKLVDFGIAVRAGQGAVAEGTPRYMPPEQWAGAPLGPAADVYAATAVFYECLTGRPPYPQAELPALATAHRSAPVPVDDVPPPVRALVARGLAKDPAARPPSAAAFLGELEPAARAGYGPNWAGQGAAALAGTVGTVGTVAAVLPSPLGGIPGAGAPAAGPGGAAMGTQADASGVGMSAAQSGGRPDLARMPDRGPGDGGVGTTAAGGRSEPARTPDAQAGADGGAGDAAAQPGPGSGGSRTGEGPGGQSTPDGMGSAAGRQPPHREPASVRGERVGRRWWPRTRAGRGALVAGAGLGAAAVVITTVLVVREPAPPPPESAAAGTEATLPASAPNEPDEAGSLIEEQAGAQESGAFSFTWEACCNNSLAGSGQLAPDGSVTNLAELSNPDAFAGGGGAPPDDLAVPVAAYVGPDEIHVDMGSGWQSFPVDEVDATAGLPQWVAFRANTVHYGVSPLHAAALVTATGRPTVSTSGELTTYSGTAALDELAEDEFAGELYSTPGEPGVEITVAYEVTVDDEYVPQTLTVTEQIVGQGVPLPPTVLTVEYADWGGVAERLEPPA